MLKPQKYKRSGAHPTVDHETKEEARAQRRPILRPRYSILTSNPCERRV